MRIAFMHPTYWPEVRRGSERLVHDLTVGLVGRGHEVTLLTTHPAATSVSEEEGVRVVRTRRPPRAAPLRWYEDFISNVPVAIWRLLRGGYDLAHACFAADAWAAARARRSFGGPPYVFSMHGIPIREYLVARRYRIDQLKESIAGAAATTVLSEAAAEAVRRYLLSEPLVVPGGVVGEKYAVDEPPAGRPTLVAVASFADPRKRGELLLEAFGLLRQRRPDAELILVGAPDPHLKAALPEAAPGARWVEPDGTEALARLYASAWATVLPSVDEAFGLVLVESLAAGTPVVAARSGGCPEIVDDPAIGRSFEPDDAADLARAIGEALELSGKEGTAGACRAHARRFDISVALDRFEEIYADAVAGRPPS